MFRILVCLFVLVCMCSGEASAQSFGDAFFSGQAAIGGKYCTCKGDDPETIESLRSFLNGLAEGLKRKWQLRDLSDAAGDEEPRVLAMFEQGTWTVKCAESKAELPAYRLAVNLVKDELHAKLLPPIKKPFAIVFVFDADNEILVETEVKGSVIQARDKSTQDWKPFEDQQPISSSERDIDFGPFMAELQRRIKRAWFPPGLTASKRVMLTFKIHSDGSLSDLRIPQSSGLASLNQACLKSVENAAPFRPLPDGAPPYVHIQFTFDLGGLKHKCETGDPLCEFALSSSPDLVWYRRTNLHVPTSELVLPSRFQTLYGEF